MLWMIAGALLIFILTVHISWKLWMFSFKASHMPSLPVIPWLGCVPLLPSNSAEALKIGTKFNEKFELSCMWLGPLPLIRSSNVDFSADILRSKVLISKAAIYRLWDAWLGGSVLTLTGSEWEKRRHLINPGFHFNILNEYTAVFETHAVALNEKLYSIASIGEAVDIQKIMALCTLGIICETAMGIKLNSENLLYKGYADAIEKVKCALANRFARPWLWPDFTFKCSQYGSDYYKNLNIMELFTRSVINDRIESRVANNEELKKHFLDILLDAYERDEIDVAGIIKEVNTFMFAGHDTSSSALSWTLYHLGLHQEIQDKLYKEVESCLDNPGSIKDKITSTQYLEMVIKESLRLTPPIHNIARSVDHNTKINGNHLVKGSSIGILIQGMQTNPKYWPNPKVFDPERFSKINSVHRRPHTFVPFSSGPRNCVGQKFAMLEMKIILFTILSKFKIVTVKQNIQTCIKTIYVSDNGLWIKFLERM